MPRTPVEVIASFVSAINAMDMIALRALMTDDHVFTDSRGASYFGADKMIENWQKFLHAYPKYWISVDHSLAKGFRVALFGNAGGKWRVAGTVVPGSWQVSAAFLGEVNKDKVSRWSVYCDSSWVTPPLQPEYPAPAIIEV